MLKDFLLAFIPIFVAVDAIGVLPIFIGLTEGIEFKEKIKVIMHSMFTAIMLAICFIFLGKAIFKFLGITVSDFMIAGGIILFSIALIDILNVEKKRYGNIKDLGVVPLGTPLIVGPAVLTSSIIIVEEYGTAITFASVFVNVLLAGVIFASSHFLIRIIGESGARALSKVMNLLLGAIAVMLIRKGLFQLFPHI